MEGAGPPIWKERENCGAKQPLPSVHKCEREEERDQLLSGLWPAPVGESWLVAHLGSRASWGPRHCPGKEVGGRGADLGPNPLPDSNSVPY